ncbi:MAG: diguanylate cyclase [Candidatus Thiodiazotropha sp.]|jgi:diguanylate cyclase (GGDEF)-like protein
MSYRFTDLVDIGTFRSMLQSFYQATGILHGLVDSENQVISAIGWQEACLNFHRAYPLSKERCEESNRRMAKQLGCSGFVGGLCLNGLMDYVCPIVIEGEQMATLYFGQVLHTPPDMALFRRQAQECGYDEEAYLEAIRKVPVVSQEKVEPIMTFFSQLAQMLAQSGLDRLRARQAEQRVEDLNRNLAQRIQDRTKELAAKNQQLAADIALRRKAETELSEKQAQLQAILDSLPIGVGWFRLGKLEYINRKFTELFGYRLEEIATLKRLNRLAFPDATFRKRVIERWSRQVAKAKNTEADPPVLEAPVVCKDGGIRYGMINASWIGERNLINFSDITDRWHAEHRNQMRNEILEAIATGASLTEILIAVVRDVETENPEMLCSILLLDGDGKCLHTGAAPSLPDFYNQAINGIEIGECVGSCGTAAYTHKRVVVADVQTHSYWKGFRELASRAGVASCWSEPVFSSKGRVLGTFAIYHRQPGEPSGQDLLLIGQIANLVSIAIEHHQALDELEHRAHTDSLTGVANRGRFMELAEAEMARARRYGNPYAVFLLDIDHFKEVNDKHGHKSGDVVLREFTSIMKQVLREVDIIGRIGGEEFAVLLPQTEPKKASRVAERLRETIASTNIAITNDTPLQITVSIGISLPSANSNLIDEILRKADTALYMAKNSGRNRVCVSDVR